MRFPLFVKKLLIRSGIASMLPGVRRLTDGAGSFLHYYSDRVLSLPLLDLATLAHFQEIQGPDAINLALGAPRLDLVPSGSTRLPADRRGWPGHWGLDELREAVSERLGRERRLAVSPTDGILITHGIAGGLNVVLDTFINGGDKVVLFDPSSPLYRLSLEPRQGRIRWLDCWNESGRLRFRLDLLARALRGARLLVVNSPHNPTGGVIAPEDLEQVAWWARKRNVLIFSDEAFSRFQYEGDMSSILSFQDARDRTIIAGGVSQEFGLASGRVGWLAGHRNLLRPCALSQTLHTPFVPTLCQQIALTALRQGSDCFQPIRAEFASRRQYAWERLHSMLLEASWPGGAYFLWAPVHKLGLDGRSFAERLLRERKVLVTPGEFFGPGGSGYIRLSYAAEDGRLREGLSRIGELVRDMPHGQQTIEKRAA